MWSPHHHLETLIWIGSWGVMVFGAALVLCAPWIVRAFKRRYWLFVAGAFAILRVGPLVLIHLVLRHPSGPDKLAWALHGKSALRGLLPYLDYRSEYCPLFSYVIAPFFLIFNEQMAPVVAFLFFDLLAILVLLRLERRLALGRLVTTLYLLSPISWFMIVRYGQDEVIGAFFVGLMLMLSLTWSGAALGLLAGIGTVATKLLFLVPAFPILLSARRRVWGFVTAGAVILLCYAPFLNLGSGLIQWAPRRGSWIGASPWMAAGADSGTLWLAAQVISMTVMCALAVVVALRINRLGPVNAGIVLYSGLMLVSPRVWYTYALLILPLLCIRVARSRSRRELVLFALYGLVAVAHFSAYRLWRSGVHSGPNPVVRLVSLAGAAYHCYLLVTSLRSKPVVGPGPAA